MRNSAGRRGAAFFLAAGGWEDRGRPVRTAGQRGWGMQGPAGGGTKGRGVRRRKPGRGEGDTGVRPKTGRKDRDMRPGVERQTAGRLRQKSRNVVRVPD